MLLNEIKRIFELDGSPLQSALDSLDINTHAQHREGADINDADFRPVVAKFVVSPVDPFDKGGATSELITYMKTKSNGNDAALKKAYETVTDNGEIVQNQIEAMENQFIQAIKDLDGVKELANGADAYNAIIALKKSLTGGKTPTYMSNADFVRDVLINKNDQITSTMMKRATSEAFSKGSANQIKNFTTSAEFLKDPTNTASKDLTPNGLTELRSRIVGFLAVFERLRINAVGLIGAIEAAGNKLGLASNGEVTAKPGAAPAPEATPAP